MQDQNRYSITRRKFLKGSTVLGGAALLESSGVLAGTTNNRNFPKTAEGWFNRPMRWANLTLVENDPGKYDPDFWLDLYKRVHVDAACLSAGGYMAYYPTKVPFHYTAKSIRRGEDPFGYLFKGCREQGMAVTARLDAHAVHDDVYAHHKEWIGKDYQGNFRKHPYMSGAWLTCPFGPYGFDHLSKILKEVSNNYYPDGIFVNRWQGTGMCYCESCKKLFFEASGRELPNFKPAGVFDFALPKEDPATPAYLEWRKNRLFALWDLWDGIVRQENPHARFIPNMGGSLRGAIDMSEFGKRADYLTVDRQGRTGGGAIWSIGIAAKEFRAVLGNKPIGAGFAFGLQSKYRYIDSVHGNDGEFYMWAVEAIANGIRPSFGKTSASVEDTRWIKDIEKLFSWHYSVEKYLRNQQSMAKVAIVYTQQENNGPGSVNAGVGMYQALIEARIPFEMVHIALLDAAHVDAYQLLIFPGITNMSDKQLEQVNEYVGRGGNVLTTFDTSLCDERGHERKELGLAPLFGVRYLGERAGPLNNSYFRLEADPQSKARHPVLQGWEGVNRIINTSYLLKVQATEVHEAYPLTHIPGYPSLPMEELYPRETAVKEPLVYLKRSGKGKVVYFPGNIDSSFDELLLEDHALLLKNCFSWLRGADAISIKGSGMYDVNFWRQASSYTVHIVNLNNAMTMKGYYRDFVPSPELQVSIRLPEGEVGKNVKALVHNRDIPFTNASGLIEITIPSILAHEVIAIDV